ncbi:glycosyltransferase family 4 protein [Flavobacterium agricola]|uniref:Glycosyltransferase family 4 protein n=1 Tax=Flavobacterium agricola TaxID=2870839 RepID=A0ABY6LYM6_9FLAO|nr:glycosyltransferase family 4 protein [Flavobacterium agricola]UYW00504.1 glycosyltransferase family 4 protein [Flavobacterium agricola]
MKIAFLTPEYPHEITGSSGGIGTSIKNLAEALTKHGHQVRVLVYGQKQDAVFSEGNLYIQQIKNVKLKGLSWYLTRKKIEKIIDALYAKQEIELVEAPDWTGITSYIHPEKCPIIIKLHGSDTYFCDIENRPVKWINKHHEAKALRQANSIISVSNFTKSYTQSLFNLDYNIKVIQNGINLLNFQETPFINKPIILYFGTLIRKKGVLEIPEIFNQVLKKKPEAQLVLVGGDSVDILSGSQSTWKLMYDKLSPFAQKQVNYVGKLAHHEVVSIIRSVKVCIFPSFAEAFPVSWLEAMAMQKAIVASNIGWANELIISGENGFLVHPKNTIEFANKIVELLNNDQLAYKMGQNARNHIIDNFDINIIAQKNIKLYKTLII